jgi:hypothetical protein
MTDDVARRIATANNMAVRQRNYRRARDRALARLANAYPDDYKELLEQERANDELMGKKWLDITGATAASQLDTRASTTTTRPQASNNGEDEGNYGGEA